MIKRRSMIKILLLDVKLSQRLMKQENIEKISRNIDSIYRYRYKLYIIKRNNVGDQ